MAVRHLESTRDPRHRMDSEHPPRRDAPPWCPVRSGPGDRRSRAAGRRGRLLAGRSITEPLPRALGRGGDRLPLLSATGRAARDAAAADRLAGVRDDPHDRHLRVDVVLRGALVVRPARARTPIPPVQDRPTGRRHLPRLRPDGQRAVDPRRVDDRRAPAPGGLVDPAGHEGHLRHRLVVAPAARRVARRGDRGSVRAPRSSRSRSP